MDMFSIREKKLIINISFNHSCDILNSDRKNKKHSNERILHNYGIMAKVGTIFINK